MEPFVEKVVGTIEKFNMLARSGDRLVVAVSGGPDSIALLHILCSLEALYHLSLYVAHLNHMRRGVESDRDEQFVRELARNWRLPVRVARIDFPNNGKQRKGFQVRARDARYQFLERLADELHAPKIALGQTADDYAESIMIWLLRGTGMDGLSGIPPIREATTAKIIRPLIESSHSEIKSYCHRHSLPYRIDSSNLSLDYLRNKVRLKLLPYLAERYNPKIREALCRTGDLMLRDLEFLGLATESAVSAVTLTREYNKVIIDLVMLSTYHLAIQRRVIRLILKKLSIEPILAHIDSVLELLSTRKGTGTEVSLHGQAVAVKSYDKLIIQKSVARERKKSLKSSLCIPGRTYIPQLELVFTAKLLKGPINLSKTDISRFEAYINYDKLMSPVCVRTRAPGDRFQPLGLAGTKKLKDLFIDEKVPRDERDKIPIVTSQDRIVWLVGWRLDERFKIDASTLSILYLKARAGHKKPET